MTRRRAAAVGAVTVTVARRASGRGVAVALLALSAATLLLGYVALWWSGGPSRTVHAVMAAAVVTQLTAFVLLGARRRDGRLGAAWVAVGAVVVLVGGVLVTVIVSADAGAAEPLLGGLPRRAGLVLYGVGLAPLVLLAGSFARSFDTWVPTEAEVEQVRALRPPLAGEDARL
jgi:hypothetical protein